MTQKKVASKSRVATLKINIQKEWYADDFQIAFDVFNRVYLFNEALQDAYIRVTKGDFPADRGDKKEQMERLLKQISGPLVSECYAIFGHNVDKNAGRRVYFGVEKASILLVKRINFNSPGSIDFIGFAKAFEVFRDWFNRYIPNEGEKLDNELKRQKIEDAKFERAQKKIAMMRELGMSNEDITALVGLEALNLTRIEYLRKKEQITGVEIVNE